ncbi:hypothetical protein [Actinomadura formosensis]|uniref:hypothetical protein n=1 Tax=Actinomadura formosensis TaxID=60706 RepID=UPI00083178FC|nr:hypothetical protein [Actinomadura formosensis]
MQSFLPLVALVAAVGCPVAARIWWRRRWAGQAGLARRTPGVKGAPELRVTLGPRAYRWPFAMAVAGPLIGLGLCASTLPTSYAGTVAGPLIVYGGGGLMVGLVGVIWALTVHRSRLIVTIRGDGIALRHRDDEATIPSSAVHAVGLTWPISDPVWTTWYDPAAAPGIDTVTKVGRRDQKEAVATLLRDRSLPAGWLEAVHAATIEILGGTWRVLDDRGQEVPGPSPRALFDADRVLVNGEGRYRNERGGALLAQACGRLMKKSTEGASFFATNPNKRRRSIVLRDPHARTMLIINRMPRTLGRERMTVLDADGNSLGELGGRGEMSLRSAGGTLLGTVHQDGGRYAVTDTTGREVASLRTKSKADNSRMWLEFSPECPEPLRPLALALPIAVRITRQV